MNTYIDPYSNLSKKSIYRSKLTFVGKYDIIHNVFLDMHPICVEK